MWVTAYTDASYRPDTNTGSWAVWIRSVSGRVKESGICPKKVKDSFQAEYFSMLMGVKVALKSWKNIEGILLVNDCQGAIRSIWPWSPTQKTILWMREELDALRKDGHEIRTKHVKGHQRKGTPQS